MKKKLFSVAAFAVAAILLASSLAACGNSADSDTGSSAAESIVTTAPEGVVTTAAEASAESSSASNAESSAASEANEKPDAAELDGTYVFVKMTSDGNDATEQIERLKEMGLPTDLVFDGDKANLMGTTYTVKDGKLIDDEDELSFTVDGNRITVVDEESEMVFEKQ